jgi:hypothetical protein
MLCNFLIPIGRGLSKTDRKSVSAFLQVLRTLYKFNGSGFVVKWLKVQYVNFQQAVGGNPLQDTAPLGCRISRAGDGLPRVIPKSDRVLIRHGDVGTIRKWISLFGLYRELNVPGKLKLETITDPCTGNPDCQVMDPKTFLDLFQIGPHPSLSAKAFEISSASAALSGEPATSTASLVAAVKAWANSGQSDLLMDWLDFTSSYGLIDIISSFLRSTTLQVPPNSTNVLGRLGFKEEPAGKIRVFAMVDPLTQWALKPMHDWIFSILRRIPMDGTFDQLRPLSRAGWDTRFYCFDLSAATDRIPVRFSQRLLSAMIGEFGARLWVSLLVDRPYYNPKSKDFVKYGCGQPMGALTSWAFGLALVHHWIVQSAAERAFGHLTKPFSRYALLGDDIVIWNDKVAKHYQDILAELGVQIGLHKSLISDSSVEFAKRYFFKQTDCSPISFSEWWTATHHLGAALEFSRHFPKLDTSFLWKRALGLTRLGATRWGRLSTNYSILWNLEHSLSLWSFYSTLPWGSTRMVPHNQWRSLSGSYRDRALRAILSARKDLENRRTIDPDKIEESVIRMALALDQGWYEQIDRLSELEGTLGSNLDPGNLELFREALKDSRNFSQHFDEMKWRDRVRLWTLSSYHRIRRNGY